MNTNLPLDYTRLIALACSLLALAAACDPDRDTNEQTNPDLHVSPTSYAQRCQIELGGTAISITYDGRARQYCAFVLTGDATFRDGLDGVGTGGKRNDDGLDGVGTGGKSTCAVLTETPHTHVIAERHVGVCSSSMSLSTGESLQLDAALDTAGLGTRPEEPTDPTEPSNSAQCLKALDCGQASLGQDKESLYVCRAGTYTLVQACEHGCKENQDPDADACHTAPPVEQDICRDDTNGLYCGETLGLDAATLYRCDDGQIQVAENCRGLCETRPLGEHDRCSKCPSLNGDYCGDGIERDRDTLYSCTEGFYTVKEPCTHGCRIAPPGQNDACSPEPTSCPGGNGDYCGDKNGNDSGNLYRCTDGNYSLEQQCEHGCDVGAPGQNDTCSSAPASCPSGNGDYCGDENGNDRDNLYRCVNGTYSLEQQCTNGCNIGAPGQNDTCAPL